MRPLTRSARDGSCRVHGVHAGHRGGCLRCGAGAVDTHRVVRDSDRARWAASTARVLDLAAEVDPDAAHARDLAEEARAAADWYRAAAAEDADTDCA